MTDRDALRDLAKLLRDVAGRLDRIAALVTEPEAKFICDLLEPSTNELGVKLDEVQKGDWVEQGCPPPELRYGGPKRNPNQ